MKLFQVKENAYKKIEELETKNKKLETSIDEVSKQSELMKQKYDDIISDFNTKNNKLLARIESSKLSSDEKEALLQEQQQAQLDMLRELQSLQARPDKVITETRVALQKRAFNFT